MFDSMMRFVKKPEVLGPVAAVMYGTISISITFFNKAVMSVWQFNFGNTMIFFQEICSIFLMYVMRHYGYIKFKDFNKDTARNCVPLALWFVAGVVTSLCALPFLNIPVYNTLRRVSTILVILVDYFWAHKKTPTDETMSVVAMVAGAFVAGYGDLTFNFIGYALALLSCLTNAGYLVWIRETKDKTRCGEFEMMLYNNILSMPVVILLILILEIKDVLAYQYWTNPGFLICFFMSSVLAFLLNYSIFLCSTVNSPLTTSVTGQIKAIVAVIVGLFFFGDVIITPSLLLGLFVSCVGSVYYAVIKYRQSAARRAATTLPTSNPGSSASADTTVEISSQESKTDAAPQETPRDTVTEVLEEQEPKIN